MSGFTCFHTGLFPGTSDAFSLSARLQMVPSQDDFQNRANGSVHYKIPSQLAQKNKVDDTARRFPELEHFEFVCMIPSSKRPANSFYVDQTILAHEKATAQPSSIVLLDVDRANNTQLADFMQNQAVRQCPISVIRRPKIQYDSTILFDFQFAEKPDGRGRMAAKDDPALKRWRSQEALDFMHVSKYALQNYPSTNWFVFLQDDAVCHGKPEGHLLALLHNSTGTNDGIVRLNSLGNVAFLIHILLLEGAVGHMATRYNAVPVDWLLDAYLALLKIKSPQKVTNLGMWITAGKQIIRM
jgi:hypothetical protein